MGFDEAVTSCFRKFITFQGRAPRSEYWWFILFSILGGFVFGFIDALLLGVGPDDFGILSLLFSIALLLPSISVSVRRLHDRNMSGWWLLISFIPFAGAIVLLVLYVMRGTEGRNRFGPDPLGSKGGYDDHDDSGDFRRSSIPNVSQN